MLKPTVIRAVMSDEEFDKELEVYKDYYGDGSAGVAAAKADQYMAGLLHRSGWTQDQLAKRMGKSRPWLVCRLRFGRFIAYATNVTMVTFDLPSELTERAFRGYWERTKKTSIDDEGGRFEAVIALMQAPPDEDEDEEEVTTPREEKRAPASQTDKAIKIIKAKKEKGEPVVRLELGREHGISETAFRQADFYVRGLEAGKRGAVKTEAAVEVKPVALDQSILSANMRVKFDALVKRERESMARTIQEQVQARNRQHIEEYILPKYRDRLEKAEMILGRSRKPFTRLEFQSMLIRPLLEDHSTSENRRAAYDLLKEREIMLCPSEREKPLSEGFPRTLEELTAMRKQVALSRKRKKG